MPIEQENVRVVQGIYDAFMRGDVPAILAQVSEEVDWCVVGPKVVPFAGQFHGREEVARFFQVAAEATDRSDESLKPEVQELIAQGEKVVAFGNDRVQFRPGGLYDGWWIHVWTLREGRVVALREYFDTAMAVELCRAAG